MRRLVMLAALVAGCGGAEPAEKAATAPAGLCEDVGDPCDGSCSEPTVCVHGVCVDAFPRRYRISVGLVEFAELAPDGKPWDASEDGSGPAPDPYVRIRVGNDAPFSLEAQPHPDTFSADFTGAVGAGTVVELRDYDTLQITVMDDDGPGPGDTRLGELAAEWESGQLTHAGIAEALRCASFEGYSVQGEPRAPGNRVQVTLEPE